MPETPTVLDSGICAFALHDFLHPDPRHDESLAVAGTVFRAILTVFDSLLVRVFPEDSLLHNDSPAMPACAAFCVTDAPSCRML